MVIAAIKIGNENLLSLSRTDVHIDFSAQIRAVYTNRCFVISHKIHNFTSLSAPVIRGGFLCLITHSDGQHYKKESENAYDEVRNCQSCIVEKEIETPSITTSE